MKPVNPAILTEGEIDYEKLNKLVMENQGLIIHQIKRIRGTPWGKRHNGDELFQEGFIASRKAVINFQPERGNRLSTVISEYVQHHLANFCRPKQKRNTKSNLHIYHHLDNVLHQMIVEEQIQLISEKVKEKHLDIVKKRVDGILAREIGLEYNLSKQRISQIYLKTLEKVRLLFPKEN